MNEREYQSLKESIRTEGLKDAIIVNSDGHIIDGQHRKRACIELGIKPRYSIVEFPTSHLIKRIKLYPLLRNREYKMLERLRERAAKKKAISLLKK